MEDIYKLSFIPKASTSYGIHASSLSGFPLQSLFPTWEFFCSCILGLFSLPSSTVFLHLSLCPPVIDNDAICWIWLEEILSCCFLATLSFFFFLWAGSVLGQGIFLHILTHASSLWWIFVIFESLEKYDIFFSVPLFFFHTRFWQLITQLPSILFWKLPDSFNVSWDGLHLTGCECLQHRCLHLSHSFSGFPEFSPNRIQFISA